MSSYMHLLKQGTDQRHNLQHHAHKTTRPHTPRLRRPLDLDLVISLPRVVDEPIRFNALLLVVVEPGIYGGGGAGELRPSREVAFL
jgi:hypothetical protein